ncbi:MAG: hypothetical protein OEV93_02540 [Candidatus Moranbacteria bacterium]|nr:hypothetical protein [Candidatus Moranbacteria bacterium]
MQEINGTSAIFGIASSIFVFVGFFPYIRDIKNKKIRPHILSWTGWGFVTGLGAVAMLSEMFTWGVAIVVANTVACFLIAIYAKIKKVGVLESSAYDFSLFALGIIGLILWQVTDNPDLAVIFAILADFSFGLPMLIKIHKDPCSESVFPWTMAMFAAVTGLFAVAYVSFTEIAYPTYLAAYDSTVLFLILYVRKIKGCNWSD